MLPISVVCILPTPALRHALPHALSSLSSETTGPLQGRSQVLKPHYLKGQLGAGAIHEHLAAHSRCTDKCWVGRLSIACGTYV